MNLFSQNGYHTYTELANQIDQEAHNALRPIFEKWLDAGCSPRELSYVITRAAIDIELMEILTRNGELHKARQKAKEAKRAEGQG